jgi:hypothetical protein
MRFSCPCLLDACPGSAKSPERNWRKAAQGYVPPTSLLDPSRARRNRCRLRMAQSGFGGRYERVVFGLDPTSCARIGASHVALGDEADCISGYLHGATASGALPRGLVGTPWILRLSICCHCPNPKLERDSVMHASRNSSARGRRTAARAMTMPPMQRAAIASARVTARSAILDHAPLQDASHHRLEHGLKGTHCSLAAARDVARRCGHRA